MNNDISVLIPVYNAEAYISRCVKSIQNQTLQPLEIILVDDGSTDNSVAVCNQLALAWDRVRVIPRDHAGVSSARNVALDAATGNWIAFIDADDYVSPIFLETLYHVCKTKDVPLAQCRQRRTENEDEICEHFDVEENVHVYEGKAAHLLLAGDDRGFFRCMLPGTLYNRRIFDTLRFPEGLIHEDEAAAAQILLAANKIAFLDAQLYFYYKNPSSIMNQKFNKNRYDIFPILLERINCYQKLEWDNLVFLTKLRYMISFLDCLVLTIKDIPDSAKEQEWLKASYQECLADLAKERWADEGTMEELHGFYENLDTKPLYSYRYAVEWIHAHPEILH